MFVSRGLAKRKRKALKEQFIKNVTFFSKTSPINIYDTSQFSLFSQIVWRNWWNKNRARNPSIQENTLKDNHAFTIGSTFKGLKKE